ncbi:MAG: hypothetical protein JXB62_14975 [Pirellulales bacterium]|nr:hypothetical protein [Pirellulales bacterium]
MKTCHASLTTGRISCLSVWPSNFLAQSPDVAQIKPEVRTGFAHAGWEYDRDREDVKQ